MRLNCRIAFHRETMASRLFVPRVVSTVEVIEHLITQAQSAGGDSHSCGYHVNSGGDACTHFHEGQRG